MYEHRDGYCDKCRRKKEHCICNVMIKEDCEDEYIDSKHESFFEDQKDCSPKHDDCRPPRPPKHDDCPPKHDDCPPKKDDCPPKKDDCPPKKDDCCEPKKCPPIKKDCSPKKDPCHKWPGYDPCKRCPIVVDDLCDMECFIPLIAIVAILLCSGTIDEDNIQLLLIFVLLYLVIL